MKYILQKVKHLWKAKGRHGTHSPFVYAYVEQVMRAKKQFHAGVSGFLCQKQINLIGRTLQYLDARTVYADAALYGLVSLISKEASRTIMVLPLDVSRQDYEPGACFVCLSVAANIDFLREVASRQICAAIVPLDQKNESGKHYWETLHQDPVFKMTLDAWYIGFVSNHPDFKIKQYFRLR